MSKPLAFGLNMGKKPGSSKPAPPTRRKLFGGNGDSDDEDSGSKGGQKTSAVLEIGGLDDLGSSIPSSRGDDTKKSRPKQTKGPPTQPPKLKSKGQPNAMFGDLSSALSARKNAEAAAEMDPNVFEYDAVYDSLKPTKKKEPTEEEGGAERRPRYMKNLLQAADVRKRDLLIAEEKKIAREREAEGDEFAGTEKFVTEAYKRQQEENRRIEEEEKRREAEEAKKNEGGGMSTFYRNMLNKGEERHSQAVKAAEDAVKKGPQQDTTQPDEDMTDEQSEAKRAQELNEKGASIALNEDGQVVDKRQLLKGGLNLGPKKGPAAPIKKDDRADSAHRGDRRPMSGSQVGGKQAMRERQSRMLAEQLEQSMKRSRETSETQREETERAAKSRKTDGDISSAKERYLARKKAAEEEKKNKTGAV